MEGLKILPKHAWGGGPPAQPGGEGQCGSRNRFGCRSRVGQNITGGDTENGQAVRSEGRIAHLIPHRPIGAIMRIAVDFNRQFGLRAVEV